PARGRPAARSRPSRRVALGGRRAGHAGEVAPEADEQRVEAELRRDVELLERAPRLAHALARELRARDPLARRILRQSVEPVGVDDCAAGSDRDGDQVAVPPRELLERREQLVSFCPALRAAGPLLGLTRPELERRRDLLGLDPCLGTPLLDA